MPNVKTTTIKVIVRMEKGPNNTMRPIVFLPNSPARAGLVAYYAPIEGHGEAELDYYRSCKLADDTTAEEMRAHYYNLSDDFIKVRLAKKLLHKDLNEAWSCYRLAAKQYFSQSA